MAMSGVPYELNERRGGRSNARMRRCVSPIKGKFCCKLLIANSQSSKRIHYLEPLPKELSNL